MPEIELKHILNIAEYEKVREAKREAIIALKRNRRIEVGPNLSLVFENRDTVLFQIHEMVRTERLVDDRKIQDEIDAYRSLLPGPWELSATLFIEIPGIADFPHEKAREAVNYFQGFDNGGIALETASARSVAVFEAGFSNEEKMAAVQYLRFPVAGMLLDEIANPSVALTLSASNGRYQARASVSDGMRAQLLLDLGRGGAQSSLPPMWG
jgi:hypothetical protein